MESLIVPSMFGLSLCCGGYKYQTKRDVADTAPTSSEGDEGSCCSDGEKQMNNAIDAMKEFDSTKRNVAASNGENRLSQRKK